MVLEIFLILAMTGFCAYGLFATDLFIAIKGVLILVFLAKTICYWLIMRKDIRMKSWYLTFIPIDLAVIIIGICYSSIPLVFVSAIGLGFTVARIAYFASIKGKRHK